MSMRRPRQALLAFVLPLVCGAGVVLAPVARVAALAQDQNNPETLRKELADTLAQLKAAQDRKNELANENERLKAQVTAMQKEIDECRRASAAWAEQSYDLRARHAAWTVFVERHPRLKAQWELFLQSPPLYAPNEFPQWHDPLAATHATSPSTAPSTAPANGAPVEIPPASAPTPPPPPPASATAPSSTTTSAR